MASHPQQIGQGLSAHFRHCVTPMQLDSALSILGPNLRHSNSESLRALIGTVIIASLAKDFLAGRGPGQPQKSFARDPSRPRHASLPRVKAAGPFAGVRQHYQPQRRRPLFGRSAWALKRALLLKRLLLLAFFGGIAETISDYPLRGSARLSAIRTKSARDFAPIFFMTL